jgi:sugar lactone lactonase YvrE
LTLFGVLGCGGSGGGSGQRTEVFGSSEAGLVNGDLTEARFSNPVNVAVASDGTVYVADFDNDAVRAISPAGIVSTLTDQDNFSRPFGMTVSSTGRLFVQTDANDQGMRDATTGTVWEINRTTGVATVVARNLGRPRGIVAMADGRLALSDLGNSTVYILDPSNGNVTPLAGSSGNPGFANGNGAAAQFDRPYGIAVLPNGDLVLADQNNNRLRRVTMSGDVSTFAGTGAEGANNGGVASATFDHPEDVDVAPDGTIFVADHDNFVIRRIRGGQVSVFAGNGTQGFAPGTGTEAQFFGVEGISLNTNGSVLWVADGNNGDGGPFNRVRSFRTN